MNTAIPLKAQGVLLHELAHARSGDKGNRLNICVVARERHFFQLLAEILTPARVSAHFHHRCPSRVVRYDLPRLHAFNFVLDDVLDGGVNSSPGLDTHGKTLSFYLLGMVLDLPRQLLDAAESDQFSSGDAL